ncbi:MAG: LPS assembly protein LptD [Thermoanaerobaculia bacterium]
MSGPVSARSRRRALLGLALAAETFVVTGSARPCLDVRALPESDSGVLACLVPGTRVEMLNPGDLWSRIRLADGTEGWGAGRYLMEAPQQPAEAQAELAQPAEKTDEQSLSELTRINFDIPFPEEHGGGSAVGSAETVETEGENLVVASGGVEFRYRDSLLQAQRLEVDRSSRDVVAEGEVILDQGPRRITGTRLEFNLDSRTGRVENARVFADPDVYFSGTEVALLGEDVYRVKQGVVTSCIKESPGWSFRTANARVKLEGFARMRNTTMRVKKMPVLYLPYLVMPAKSERAAGFLFPNFGSSQQRGSYLGLAWFQPFGDSYDTTLFLDLYSENFTGLGTEIRYLPSESSGGRLEAYAIEDPGESETRWKVAWDHTSSDLPLGFRGVIRVRDFSDFNFFRDFERDINNAAIRRIESTGFLSGNWGSHSLNILLNENEAFYAGGDSVIGRQLPEIEYRLRSQQLGSLPLYLDLVSSINYISIQRGNLFDETYTRMDLFPQLTIPLSTLPWLSVSVTGGERVTAYEDSLTEDGTFGGGSLTRSFPTANARIVGPSFSRVFDKGIGKFAKFKHIFEPQWAYIYVGEFEEQSRVPRFDEVDVLRSTQVWGYSLINRVLAKPEDEDKFGGPREILSLAINQGFSLDDTQPLQSSRDGTVTSQEGPIGAELRFNPSRTVSLEARANYSTLFSNLLSTSLSTSFGIGRHGFGLSWFTRYDAESGEETSDQARLSASIEILPRRLTYGTQVSYDIFLDVVQSSRHALIFNGQCWGFRLEYAELNRFNQANDYDIRLALSLKNVGTFLDLTGGSRGGQF